MQPTAATLTRIVVRGLNWLGDAVMSMPALQRLREAFPAAHIALITPDKLADLWRLHPDVNEAIASRDGSGVLDIARRVRDGKFEAGLLFPNSPRSALELFLARVPRRCGISRPWRNALLTDIIPVPETEVLMRKKSESEVRRLVAHAPGGPRTTYPQSAHHACRYLDIAAALGASREPCAPRLPVPTAQINELRRKFSAGSEVIVGFNPGAEYGPAKRWPIERFVEAARRIHKQTGATCWVLGGSADRPLAQHFVGDLEKLNVMAQSLAGETSLSELCVALRACSAIITNDTGPMHLAAAVGTPVIVPFGSTSPELTGPSFPSRNQSVLIGGNAPCAPCFRRTCPVDLQCLRDVSVEQVVDSTLKALAS